MCFVRRLCCCGVGESEESESGVPQRGGGGVSERRDAEMRVRRRYVTHSRISLTATCTHHISSFTAIFMAA